MVKPKMIRRSKYNSRRTVVDGIKRRNNHEEYDHQVALFQWAQLNLGKYPELKWLYGSLNGIRLPIGLAVKAKKAGLKRGVPDIHFPIRKHGYFGLWIEMKAKDGIASPEQREFLAMVADNGCFSLVCYSWEEARDTIIFYLTGKWP